MANNGIFDKIGDFVSDIGEKFTGGDLGKEISGLLGKVKSFDPQQIQSILSALGGSADEKVQGAKADLESVKHNGEDFATKLKGYVAQLPELLKTLLPTLQSLFAKK